MRICLCVQGSLTCNGLFRASVVEAGLLSDRTAPDTQQLPSASPNNSDSAATAALAAENTKMQAELQDAAQTIKELRAMNSRLHALVTDQTTFEGA